MTGRYRQLNGPLTQPVLLECHMVGIGFQPQQFLLVVAVGGFDAALEGIEQCVKSGRGLRQFLSASPSCR